MTVYGFKAEEKARTLSRFADRWQDIESQAFVPRNGLTRGVLFIVKETIEKAVRVPSGSGEVISPGMGRVYVVRLNHQTGEINYVLTPSKSREERDVYSLDESRTYEPPETTPPPPPGGGTPDMWTLSSGDTFQLSSGDDFGLSSSSSPPAPPPNINEVPTGAEVLLAFRDSWNRLFVINSADSRIEKAFVGASRIEPGSLGDIEVDGETGKTGYWDHAEGNKALLPFGEIWVQHISGMYYQIVGAGCDALTDPSPL